MSEEKNIQETTQQQQSLQVKKEAKLVKKDKKPNFFVRSGKGIAKWFRELKAEAKKVVWPARKQVVNNTIVVIIAAIVVCIFIYILDITFGTIRDFIAQIV